MHSQLWRNFCSKQFWSNTEIELEAIEAVGTAMNRRLNTVRHVSAGRVKRAFSQRLVTHNESSVAWQFLACRSLLAICCKQQFRKQAVCGKVSSKNKLEHTA